MEENRYIFHLSFNNVFKMQLNKKKTLNPHKIIPVALSLSYIIYERLLNKGIPSTTKQLQDKSIELYDQNNTIKDVHKEFTFEDLREHQTQKNKAILDKQDLFYAVLAFFATKAWISKDTVYIDVKPTKVINILDTIARILGGKRLKHLYEKEEHFVLYEFKQKNTPYMSQNSIPLVYNIDQRLKTFIYHLPENINIKYVYKLNDIEQNQNSKYIIFPQPQDIKKNDLDFQLFYLNSLQTQLDKKDEKIINYTRIHKQRYNLINKSPVINFMKDMIGYNFLKRNIGIPKYLSTPKLSPLKNEFYDFILEIDNVALFNFYKPDVSTIDVLEKNEILNIVKIRFFVTSEFEHNLKNFINNLPKQIKIIKVVSSLQRDDRFNVIEDIQKKKGFKKDNIHKNKDKKSDFIQIYPYNKVFSEQIKYRPSEDKLIYKLVNKREKKHWW